MLSTSSCLIFFSRWFKLVVLELLKNPFKLKSRQAFTKLVLFYCYLKYNNGFWMTCQTVTRCVFRYCILLYFKTFHTWEWTERKRKRTFQGILNSVLFSLHTLMLHFKRTTGCAALLRLLMNSETQADVCLCICVWYFGVSLFCILSVCPELSLFHVHRQKSYSLQKPIR